MELQSGKLYRHLPERFIHIKAYNEYPTKVTTSQCKTILVFYKNVYIHTRKKSKIYHNGRVLDGHDARHDVDNPLRVDDDVVSQKLVVEKLNGPQVMQKHQSSLDL